MVEKDVYQEIANLKEKVQSITIASSNNEGKVLSSYAPFVEDNNKIYIIISKIAEHYGNINTERIFNMQLIEDEQDAQMIFFRKRINYQVYAKKITDYGNIVRQFKDEKMVKMLLTMDFDIFECTKVEGKAVLGAGKAYFLDANDKIIEQDTGDRKYG